MTDQPGSGRRARGRRGSLIEWLLRQELLRGPFAFADYWAGVLRLDGIGRGEAERPGLFDRTLFRIGLDRPDLEVPRLRYYLALFLAGPLLLPFRFFRRLGRYRIRYRSSVGEEVVEKLRPFRLELRPGRAGRVDVAHGDRVLARDVADPFRLAAFSSLFYAAYRLPLAALTGIVLVGLAVPVLTALDLAEAVTGHLVLIGFPGLALVLWLLYRDGSTAVLGALPVLIGLAIVRPLGLGPGVDWTPFFGALAGLFLLYLAVDWFFLPRPVPPVLMLYTADGPARPYARPETDAPWWLEGEVYWVWRYLMLSPAELNKFWERDWERVELWVRADGERAGMLEWVVTDAHWRELWTPIERLISDETARRCRADVGRALESGEGGTWVVEVDANLLFHTPFVRVVDFLPEAGHVPVRGVGRMIRGLWRSPAEDDPDAYVEALDRVRIREGVDILEDVPEFIAHLTARHLLSRPWRYWRYPLGAARRREHRLYGPPGHEPPPPAAARSLQIKRESR